MIDIGALRREFRAMVTWATNSMFVWTATANSTALGKEDAVKTGDDDPTNGDGQRPVRRLEPWGVRGRPVAKQRALSLRLGSSTVIYLGIASDGGYGPTDLIDGETCIYSKNIPQALRATDAGDVVLTSKSGQTVQVNGDAEFMLLPSKLLGDLKTLCTALAGASPIVVGTTGIPVPNLSTPASTILTAIARGTYLSIVAKNG